MILVVSQYFIIYLSTFLPVRRESILLFNDVARDRCSTVFLGPGPFKLDEISDLGRSRLSGHIERILGFCRVWSSEGLRLALSVVK